MRTEWQKHIGIGERQIRKVGGVKTVAVEHEDGGIAGYQTYHASGRVDAEVFARPIRSEVDKPTFDMITKRMGAS